MTYRKSSKYTTDMSIYIYIYIYSFLVYMLKSQRIQAYLFKTKIFKMAYLSKKYLKMKR